MRSSDYSVQYRFAETKTAWQTQTVHGASRADIRQQNSAAPRRTWPRIDVRLAIQIIAQCDQPATEITDSAQHAYAPDAIHSGAVFSYRA